VGITSLVTADLRSIVCHLVRLKLFAVGIVGITKISETVR